MDIRGHTVHRVWIEEASDIAKEYYASVTFDRGGEEAAGHALGRSAAWTSRRSPATQPEALARLHVDPLTGFQAHHARWLAYHAGIDAEADRRHGRRSSSALYAASSDLDAMLMEINPLILTEDGRVVALDAKVTHRRQRRCTATRSWPSCGEAVTEDPQERMAQERGVTYVKLDGDVGILGNGAGLVMSTLDVVALAGGRPANFLDAGGGSKADEVVTALEVLLSDPKVKVLLVNIFGGITRCDEVAEGLLTALERLGATLPIVVRLDGTNEEEGRAIIAERAPANVVVETDDALGRAASRRAGEGGGMSILVDAIDPAGGAGHHRPRGRVPRHPQQGLRHARWSPASRPGKAGQDVDGIPVFNTVARRRRGHRREHGDGLRAAALRRRRASTRRSRAGVELIICITEGIPAHDMLRVYTHLRRGDQALVGPNCPGIISPGMATVGIMPTQVFSPGRVGLVSRSGTLTYQISKELALLGIGQSTVVGIGGDPVVGQLVHRHPGPLRGRPRDRPGGDGRRDRRRRGGEGGRLHRRDDVHAGRRPTSPASRPRPASRWATPGRSSPARPARPRPRRRPWRPGACAWGPTPPRWPSWSRPAWADPRRSPVGVIAAR